jgi:hypothetical protein
MVCEGVDCIQLAQNWTLDFHMLIINTIPNNFQPGIY